MFKTFSLCLILAFTTTACREKSREEQSAQSPQLLALAEIPLIVIQHDRDGALLDYLAFDSLSGEMVVRVLPAGGDQEVFVTVLGQSRSALLSRSFTMSSKIGEGFLGKVEVFVEGGQAVSLDGNQMHSPALVSPETLQILDRKLEKGELSPGSGATISILPREGE